MTSKNTENKLEPKLSDGPHNSTQDAPLAPSPDQPAQDSELLNSVFGFVRESLGKTRTGEPVQIKDFTQKFIKANEEDSLAKRGSFAQMLKEALLTGQNGTSHANLELVSSASEIGGTEIVCRVISAMVSNNFELAQNAEGMLKVVELLSQKVVELEAKRAGDGKQNREQLKQIEELREKMDNQKGKELNVENMREIEEIKNYNQYMIEMYEKESEKLRLKLKSYKHAVTTQLDNLNIKLGLSPLDQNASGNEQTSNGELGNLPFGIDQDSHTASAKDPLNFPFNQPDLFSNPFDKNFSFPRNNQSFRSSFHAFRELDGPERVNENTPNGAPGNAPEPNILEENVPIRPGRDFYKNYFMAGEMPPLDASGNPANLLSKRNGDLVLPPHVPENQSFKKLGSISKMSSKSKKSRQVRRQDLRYWTLKKAIFCWDGNTNLEIVYKEFVKNLSRLLGDLVSPKEPVVQDLSIKAFTKSSTRQNLLAVKMVLNPRYKSLIEQSWKNGSPSDFFKLKIDLIKKSAILHKPSEEDGPVEREIKNMKKFPARYNFSQATYNFTSDYVNKETINRGILAFLKKFRVN